MSKSSAQYLPLYKNIPNYIDTINEEVITHDGILRIGKVSIPGYQYFRVANDAVKRPCVIICPGVAMAYWLRHMRVRMWQAF